MQTLGEEMKEMKEKLRQAGGEAESVQMMPGTNQVHSSLEQVAQRWFTQLVQ